jgi:hypothetical protein
MLKWPRYEKLESCDNSRRTLPLTRGTAAVSSVERDERIHRVEIPSAVAGAPSPASIQHVAQRLKSPLAAALNGGAACSGASRPAEPSLHLGLTMSEPHTLPDQSRTVSPIVLIASAGSLPGLHRGDLADALAFSSEDTLAALDVIKRGCPRLIAVEDRYAASNRGRALLARVEADPALRECHVQIVTHVAEGAAPIPMTGTRRAPRFKVVDGLKVRLDGSPAVLVNVSVIGAQVIATTVLKPNQRGKFAFLDDADKAKAMPCSVAWSSLEIVDGSVRYRAGVEFSNPDTTSVQRFIDANVAARRS